MPKNGKPGTPSGGPIRGLKRPTVPKKLTPELIEEAAEILADGGSFRDACVERWNISYNTFANWLKEPNPVGLILELQVRLGQAALSHWQEMMPKLERAAAEAATETRTVEKVKLTKLYGFTNEIKSALLEIGGEELLEEMAQCAVVIKEEKEILKVLPDGNLALRILKEQERKDEKAAAELAKKAGADGMGQTIVVKRKPGSPGVQPKTESEK